MVDEVAKVAIECGVHGVQVLVASVEVQVEQVGSDIGNSFQISKALKSCRFSIISFEFLAPALCVILLPPLLGLLAGDHLPHIPETKSIMHSLKMCRIQILYWPPLD